MSDSIETMFELVLHGIRGGQFDHKLQVVQHVIKSREAAIQADKSAQLSIGDIITLSSKISPKYLAGAQCRVVGFASGAYPVEVVLLNTQSSRWQAGRPFKIANSLIG